MQKTPYGTVDLFNRVSCCPRYKARLLTLPVVWLFNTDGQEWNNGHYIKVLHAFARRCEYETRLEKCT